jgi:hypothetical protein
MAEQLELIIKASAATTATENSGTLVVPDNKGIKGVTVFVDVTAVSGTPTLDITVQRFDPAAGKWLAIVGAAFAQITTAAGQVDLTIYPGIAETANRTVSDHIGVVWRVLSTIGGGTPSVTYSIGATYLV